MSWAVNPEPEKTSKAEQGAPFTPPSLPLQSLDWTKFIPFLSDAHDGIARFDTLLGNIPNVRLFLSPLMTREAVLSSRIEGTQASLEDVFRFEAGEKAENERESDIREVINYRRAMDFSIERMEKIPLSGRLMKEAHEILLSGVRGRKKNPGNFRDNRVHIGKPGDPVERATYIPPEAQQIPDLFSNLEKYMHFDDLDVLVQLAIVHAQFEMIHPFWDGNGRIGRLLLPLFLYHKQKISHPHFYLSEYLEKERDLYYALLKGISERGNWEQWIQFFLTAIAIQSRENTVKAQEIINLYKEVVHKVEHTTRSRYTTQITDFIFSNPCFSSVYFRNQTAVPRSSGSRLLNLLEGGKIITKIVSGKGRRVSIYFFRELMDIIQ